MILNFVFGFLFTFLFSSCACAKLNVRDCEVAAKIDSGYVCGRLRKDANGDDYASFRGIPYAKQPLGELRFKELQPLEPFKEVFNATENGPVCHQVDTFYGPLMDLQHQAEDCIRISVHVPARALPEIGEYENRTLLPILTFIHGGSFEYGAGYADFFGPEYLATKDIILVTFNYRLNVPGFLSLNSSYIPGNNGLRDALTALRWLQRNAKFFGGDPDEVTLGGQSAGASMAHLISISPAVIGQGLFKRVMASSGAANSNFYSYSPNFAKVMSIAFLHLLGIDPEDNPEDIHEELISLPIETLVNTARELRTRIGGALVFAPVIEFPQPNFTTIIPQDPEYLLDDGAGKEYPLLLGFNSNECQAQRRELSDDKLRLMPPVAAVPMNLLFASNPAVVPILTLRIVDKYFDGNTNGLTYDKLLPLCAASFYIYPIIRSTKKRLAVDSQPTYIYKFGYHGENSLMKKALKYDFKGACHTEDITYVFRLNHMLGPIVENELNQTNPDSKMREWMTSIVASYVKTGYPASLDKDLVERNGTWQETGQELQYERIYTPMVLDFRPPSQALKRMETFFDELYSLGRGTWDID